MSYCNECAYCGAPSFEYTLCKECHQKFLNGEIYRNWYGEYYKANNCAYCGEESYYELCRDCYELSKNKDIIKNEDGKWVKNILKDNEYKFYDETKKYEIKNTVLNPTEQEFYDFVRQNLKKKYIITPQVNLQTIIETDTYTRNDELFRNLDFCIFRTKGYVPILAIELNGKQHYNNEYWKQRDKSIQNILEKANLKLLTIRNEDIELNEDLIKKIYNEIKHSNLNKQSEDISQIDVGTRIFHRRLGKGTIIELRDDNEIAIIKFDNKVKANIFLQIALETGATKIIKD